MVVLSVTGLFRTVLIIIGVFVVVRFLGQMMNAKRNMAEQENLKDREEKIRKAREQTARNFGKTSVINNGKSSSGDVEDVDFEEIID